jgi:hypothetical protein
MKEVDGVIISSIHRITGNEYFKQLFLRQSQNCFSARSAKEPSTQKLRLWDFLSKMGRFSPLHVFFFDEAQNYRIWSSENPHLIKVGVWNAAPQRRLIVFIVKIKEPVINEIT